MESEHQVEKLLRAAAERRRKKAGDSFRLHPATRRLLQGEVSRVYGNSAVPDATRPGWFSRVIPLLPRVVWACGIVTALALITWWALPPRQNREFSLAKTEPAPQTDRKLDLAQQEKEPGFRDSAMPQLKEPIATPDNALMPTTATPAPTQSPARPETPVKLLADKGSSDTPPSPLHEKFTRREPEPAAAKAGISDEQQLLTNSAEIAVALDSEVSRRRYGATAPTALASTASPVVSVAGGGASPGMVPPAAAPTPAEPTLDIAATRAVEGLVESRADELVSNQRFLAQAPPPGTAVVARSAPRTALVLNNFDVSQAGNELKIIDEDGSVYRGYVQDAKENASQYGTRGAPKPVGLGSVPDRRMRTVPAPGNGSPQPGASPSPLATAKLPATPQQYSFQVVGTNRSLNQKVVFTGNLLPSADPTPPPREVLAISQNIPSNAVRGQVMLQNARISGVVQVGNSRFNVEAQAVPPANTQSKP